jgi:hypothetical protein
VRQPRLPPPEALQVAHLALVVARAHLVALLHRLLQLEVVAELRRRHRRHRIVLRAVMAREILKAKVEITAISKPTTTTLSRKALALLTV